jgi:hypothetical protein
MVVIFLVDILRLVFQEIKQRPAQVHMTSGLLNSSAIALQQLKFVTAIDDNCDGLVDNGVVETVNISAGGPTTFCQGGSVVLTATYSGASLQWKKNGVDIVGATSSHILQQLQEHMLQLRQVYVVLTSTEISVVANKNPTAAITAGGPTTFCSGGSVVLTANAGGGLSYQWYKGATAIAGATSINYTATTTGNYKCRVTKTATGCFKNSNAISVSVTCKSGFIDLRIFFIEPKSCF